jgi:hypothetical protein
MENARRNEFAITLAGQERVMRADFTAIEAIEKALGKSIIAITGQVAGGDLSVTAAAIIIFHGLRGNDDKRLDYRQVGNAVVEAGLSNVSIAVVEFVSACLNGVSVGKPEGTPEPQ